MRRLLLSALVLASAASLSPAIGQKPVEPFNGKDLTGWKVKDDKKNYWVVGSFVGSAESKDLIARRRQPDAPPELANPKDGGGTDLYTEEKFGDVTVELEFMVPKGSNSGIYLMGEYEVQILDSFGKPDEKLGQGDLGAIYSAAAPKKNAAKKPGEWQKFVIEFQAPKFEGDKKVANAKFVKVTLNDVVLHENVEVAKSTGGALTGKEAPTGPLMFQGDHGPVAFRNIKITPKK